MHMQIDTRGVILLSVNCIWDFSNLVTWKSHNCNLENCKNQLSCKLESAFQVTCVTDQILPDPSLS